MKNTLVARLWCFFHLMISLHGKLGLIEDKIVLFQFTCEFSLTVNLSIDPGSITNTTEQSFPAHSSWLPIVIISNESLALKVFLRAQALRIVGHPSLQDDKAAEFPGLETSLNRKERLLDLVNGAEGSDHRFINFDGDGIKQVWKAESDQKVPRILHLNHCHLKCFPLSASNQFCGSRTNLA